MHNEIKNELTPTASLKNATMLFLFLSLLSLGIINLYGNEKDKQEMNSIKPKYLEVLKKLDESERNRLMDLRSKNIVKFRVEILKTQSQQNKKKAKERKKEIIRMLKNYSNEQDENKKVEMLKKIKLKIAEDLAEKIKINEAKIKKLSFRLEKLKKKIEFYKQHKDSAVDKTLQNLIKTLNTQKNN